VVADDVVDQEQDDRLGPSPHDHQAATTSRRQPDTIRMSSSAATTNRAPSHTSAKSPPGQSTFRPSPAQNVPKVISIAPTKSCSARLGIAATYRYVAAPRAPMTTTDAAAPTIADPIAPAAAPN